MPKEKKRGDNVGSSRSRGAGQREQDKMTRQLTELVKFLERSLQLEVEPNVNTIIDRLNKKDKKKLN